MEEDPPSTADTPETQAPATASDAAAPTEVLTVVTPAAPGPEGPVKRRLAVSMGGCGCAAAAVAGLLGIGTVLGAIIGGELLSARWTSATQEALDRWTGSEVEIGEIALRWDGVVVRDLVIRAGGPDDARVWAAVDTVRVTAADPWALAAADIAMTGLRAEGVRLTLWRGEDGKLVLPRGALSLLAAPPADLPRARAPRLEIEGITATVLSDGPASEISVDRAVLDQPELAGRALGWAELELLGVSARRAGAELSAESVVFQPLGPKLAAMAPAGAPPVSFESVEVRGVTFLGAGAQAKVGALRVETPSWGEVTTLGVITLEHARLEAGAERLAASQIRLDPGGPWTGAELPFGSVVLQGADIRLPERWAALSALARQLGADSALPWPSVSIDRLALPGALPLGRVTVQDLALEGLLLERGGLRWKGGEVASLVAGPGLGIERVLLLGGDWAWLGAPRLHAVEALGVRGALDPYAPWLGIPQDVFLLLPVGTQVVQGRAFDLHAAVALGSRSGTLTAESLQTTDTVLQPLAWTTREVAAEQVKLLVRSSSGELLFDADNAMLAPVVAAERPVLPSLRVTALDVRSGEDLVAGADEVSFVGTALTVQGGDWWTSLVSPHALTVPSMVREYVPATLGGALGTPVPWWGVDLGGLPVELHRAGGQSVLHLDDRVFGKPGWAIEVDTWSIGPAGEVCPLQAAGRVAKGTFHVRGLAHPDGKVSLALEAGGLEIKELEPYLKGELASKGLKLGQGRLALILDVLLNQQRLTLTGEATVKTVKLSVDDRDKLVTTDPKLQRGGTVELTERIVLVDVACMLDDAGCSPIEQIADAVVDDLVAAVNVPLPEPEGEAEPAPAPRRPPAPSPEPAPEPQE